MSGDRVDARGPSGPTRREFLKGAAGVALTGVGGLAARSSAQAPRRPNLLFVFSDQQSYDMLGCYGNEQVSTPRLDRFAGEGVRFANCISNCPVCTPYRGILMTGQHSLYSATVSNDWSLLPGDGRQFGQVLRDNGYRLGYVGKWHLYGGYRNRPIPPGPHRHGFDGPFLSNNCHVDFHPGKCFYWDEAGSKVMFDEWEQVGQTRQALGFLDECRPDEPFALFVSWHPPHNHNSPKQYGGYDAPGEMLARYDPSKLRLRPNTADTPLHREMLLGYMALCSSVDACFGWLLDKLEQKGLAENTIVVFTSDHGDLLRYEGQVRLMKIRPQEGSAHVPLMIRWPGRLRPRTSELLFGTLDFMPTLLTMMGLPVPETCHGLDLSGAIAAGDDDKVESLPLWMIPGIGWRGIYTRGHLYSFAARQKPEHVTSPGVDLNRLHDRRADPYGMKNLFDSPAHRALRDELHRQTLAWMERFGDTNADYRMLQKLCLPGGLNIRKPETTGIARGRPIDLLKEAAS